MRSAEAAIQDADHRISLVRQQPGSLLGKIALRLHMAEFDERSHVGQGSQAFPGGGQLLELLRRRDDRDWRGLCIAVNLSPDSDHEHPEEDWKQRAKQEEEEGLG